MHQRLTLRKALKVVLSRALPRPPMARLLHRTVAPGGSEPRHLGVSLVGERGPANFCLI
jgi:hypothetical protein